MLRYVDGWLYTVVGDIVELHRGCTTVRTGECVNRTVNITACYFTCDEDGCNHAHQTMSASLLLPIFLSICACLYPSVTPWHGPYPAWTRHQESWQCIYFPSNIYIIILLSYFVFNVDVPCCYIFFILFNPCATSCLPENVIKTDCMEWTSWSKIA